YGLQFKEFVPLDAGGPLTLQALAAGDIDVALLFTTDPAIRARHLVVLADDRDLQPAENIVPVLRWATVHRFGPGVLAALNARSARLSAAALAGLNAQVGRDGRAPRVVAERWARAQGLAGPGPGAPWATVVRRPGRRRARRPPPQYGGRGASAARPVRRHRCPAGSP